MSCFFPLLAVHDLHSDDKTIVGSFREMYDGNLWSECSDKRKTEIREQVVKNWLRRSSSHWNIKVLEVPCGKCVGCRLEYSRQWANRCVLESVVHPESTNWFLTLTIDDDHLILGKEGFATVHFDDVSEFMKRLRDRWDHQHGVSSGIRFYACSEYGDTTMRPHYHMLVFGLPLYDLELYKTTGNGDVLYKSMELTELWKQGYVVVGEFNWNTAAYTARYVMKKQTGKDAAKYEALGIERENVRMSRRPGIAKPFYEANVNSIYDLDEIVLPSTKDGQLRVISPPKYFDKCLDRDNPDLLKYIKENRERISLLQKECKKQQMGYDPVELLSNKKSSKEQKLRIFHRDIEL